MHKATQKFMENEVFKTNHMENYKCHEIVGRAIVLFFKEYIRGKPKGFDMKDVFVCESRYNEVGKSFSRIKMWNACLPEKAKNIDVELDLYDTPLNPARMHSSLVKEEPAASRKRKLSDDGSLEDISKKVGFCV